MTDRPDQYDHLGQWARDWAGLLDHIAEQRNRPVRERIAEENRKLRPVDEHGRPTDAR